MEASREVASKHSTKIENLPESILIHILSFLTTLDAIRTTLVCRTWRNLWYQVPSLSFDIIPFLSPSSSYTTTREKFIQFVNQAISIHPFTHVKKFHLHIDCSAADSHINNVNNWILHAINSKVIELDIDFDICDLNWLLTDIIYREVDKFEEFLFDFSHLKDSSVKVLKLRRSSINCPPYVVGSSGFQSVQSLFFDDLNLVNREVIDVIRFCVNLEYLTIRNCCIPNSLEIYSSKLKKCELESLFTSEVVICAPRLHSISIRKVCADVRFWEPSLVVDMVEYDDDLTLGKCSYRCRFMCSLATTKYLTVSNMYFGQEEFHKHFKEEDDALKCYKFNNITHLELRTGYAKEDIVGICLFLEHSHSLESLVIHDCYDDEERTKG